MLQPSQSPNMERGHWTVVYLLSGGDVREEHELAGGVTSVPRHLAPLSHSPTLPLSTLSPLSPLWRLDMDNVITMDGQVSDWAICSYSHSDTPWLWEAGGDDE